MRASYGSMGWDLICHRNRCDPYVIVAPTQGVLRYVPFAINASVGDTVMFMWGANNHTVTKGSQLGICNKTSELPSLPARRINPLCVSTHITEINATAHERKNLLISHPGCQ